MRFRQSARHIFLIPAVGAAVGMAVAGCGSSGSSGSAPSSSSSATTPGSPSTNASATPSTSTGGSAAQSEIEANWAAFFSASTPVAKRVTLLQNGQEFATIIAAQAKSPLASSATSKVSKVTIQSPTQAKVVYSILVGGQPALSNQNGVAVKQDGVWKVGDASFCGLLVVENSGKTSGLPAACK
jgi:hypothetical protein